MKITLEDIKNNFGKTMGPDAENFIIKNDKEIAKVLLPYILTKTEGCMAPNGYYCYRICKKFVGSCCANEDNKTFIHSLEKAIKKLNIGRQIEFNF
jgi:hypothetical protein